MRSSAGRRKGTSRTKLIARATLLGALGLYALACGTDSVTTPRDPDLVTPIQDPLFAFNNAGQCFGDDAVTFDDIVGIPGNYNVPGDVNCTTNDIDIAIATVAGQAPGQITPVQCTPGQNVNVDLEAQLVQNAESDREDIGIWIATDGGNAITGACNHYYLEDGLTGTFNDDGDKCAGMAEAATASLPLGPITVPCNVVVVDPDGDGPLQSGNYLRIGACISWKIPGGNDVCPDDKSGDGGGANLESPNDYRAATLLANSSKCNCDPFYIPVILPGQITITKNAVPNHAQDFSYTGTGGGLSNFTLDDDAGAPGADATNLASKNFSGLDPTTGNPRVVTETVPSGWVITNIACTGATTSTVAYTGAGGGTNAFEAGDNAVSIAVAAGEHVQCTFTNTAQASLDIEKISLGGTGTFDYVGTGTGVPAAFQRTTTTAGVATTTAAITLNGANMAGDKYVQETPVLAGYTLTNITCTADGATIVVGRGGSGAFVNGGGNLFDAGDNTVKITLAPGSDPSCLFENTKDATVDIEKVSVGSTGTFDFVETGPCFGANFQRTTTTAGVVTATAAVTCTAPFTDQFVQETPVPAGWAITNITCSAGGATVVIGSGGSGAFAQGTTTGFDAGDNTVKITPAAGSATSCTFENTRTASLAIQKQTVGGTGTFDFVGTGAGVSANFTRNTAGANPTTEAPFAIAVADFGTKYVQETPVLAGYTLTGISCTANGAVIVIGRGGSGAFVNGGTDGFDAGDNTVQVAIDAGDTPTCTFTNTKNATVDIEKISLGGIGTFPFVETGNCFDGLSRTTTTAGVATTTAASECAPPYPSDQYVQETAPAGWALTLISCSGTATIVIGSGGSGAFVQGTTTGYDAGDNTVKITNAAGSTAACTFTNTKLGSITIIKDVQNPATDAEDFTFTATGAGTTTPFDLDDDGETVILSNQKVFSDLLPGTRTFTEGTETNWALTGRSCTGQTSSVISIAVARQISVDLAAGENVTCTFVNQRLARLIVQKDVPGIVSTQVFDFTRSVAVLAFSLMEGQENNSGFTLAPNTYRVCELNLAVTWSASATVNAVAATLINPDAPADLGNRCVDVILAYGDSKTVVWTNTPPPGGDARTIGYWKNWSSCAQSNGKQYDKAVAAGNLDKTLDGNLPQTIGDLNVDTCLEAIAILDKSDIVSGKKMASDPAYNLAAQLLAAKLNITAGAGFCAEATAKIALAQQLLDDIGFIGTGAYKASMTATQIANANLWAGILDSYNNNTLCP